MFFYQKHTLAHSQDTGCQDSDCGWQVQTQCEVPLTSLVDGQSVFLLLCQPASKVQSNDPSAHMLGGRRG